MSINVTVVQKVAPFNVKKVLMNVFINFQPNKIHLMTSHFHIPPPPLQIERIVNQPKIEMFNFRFSTLKKTQKIG